MTPPFTHPLDDNPHPSRQSATPPSQESPIPPSQHPATLSSQDLAISEAPPTTKKDQADNRPVYITKGKRNCRSPKRDKVMLIARDALQDVPGVSSESGIIQDDDDDDDEEMADAEGEDEEGTSRSTALMMMVKKTTTALTNVNMNHLTGVRMEIELHVCLQRLVTVLAQLWTGRTLLMGEQLPSCIPSTNAMALRYQAF
jgi:hypothetical protein